MTKAVADWILRTAVRAVNNGKVEWVRKRVALRATDEPDPDFDTDEIGSESEGVEALLEAGWQLDVDA